MYQFTDTNKNAEGASAPSDNMRFNGVYLNEFIDGYRQLHVSGRHLISREVDMTAISMRNGKWFNTVRDEPRELVIAYRLEASSSEEMRDKMAKFNQLLNTSEPVPVVFDDEKGYTYYAIYADAPSDPEQHLTVIGSFRLICPSPFKYAQQKESHSGQIGVLENENILPDEITAVVSQNTQKVEIVNGTKRMVFEGNYASGDRIVIKWGDEVEIRHNSRNALLDLLQFSFPTTFTIKSNDTITGVNCSVSIKWRDMRR
ncbi:MULTISPECIES: distal tail protein Dit [unclassified Facklamia]|uniref:distal tail protein Dit n=1 Tax=Aerococcaceae TaxID=186827 RepID=UPI0013B89576|nr:MULTISPECIES: distal tail protein Dit [unclassified Facklamia]NEW65262.1 phage tail protein [Facklamia sp. 252]NEW68758.1 phage tail protein [Facklamia sp. 253]QQD66146.1 phage tail family protein [Aerococcaceae bacterium zg-252]